MKYSLKLGKDIFTIYIFSETGNFFGNQIAKLFNLEMDIFLKHFGSKIRTKKNKLSETSYLASFDQILMICQEIKKSIETNSINEELTTSIERIHLIEKFINNNEIILLNDEIEILQNQLTQYLEKIKFAWRFVENHQGILKTPELQRYVTSKYDEFFSYEPYD